MSGPGVWIWQWGTQGRVQQRCDVTGQLRWRWHTWQGGCVSPRWPWDAMLNPVPAGRNIRVTPGTMNANCKNLLQGVGAQSGLCSASCTVPSPLRGVQLKAAQQQIREAARAENWNRLMGGC